MDQEIRAELEKLHGRVNDVKERVVNLEAQQPHINVSLGRIERSVVNRPGFAGGSCVDAPFHANALEHCEPVIGCGHVSGLRVRDLPAGRHGDTRNGRKSTLRASRSWSLGAFPIPDRTDHLPLTFTTSSHARPSDRCICGAFAHAAAAAGSL